MIDTTKNACYVIHCYWTTGKGNKGEVKFISRHSSNSKQFKDFKVNYFRNVLGIKEERMNSGYNGSLGRQYTVPIASWPEMKDSVMDGITEKEKCY